MRFPAHPDIAVTLLFNVAGVLRWHYRGCCKALLAAYTKGQIGSRVDVICTRYVMQFKLEATFIALSLPVVNA